MTRRDEDEGEGEGQGQPPRPATLRRAHPSEAPLLADIHLRARQHSMPWLPLLHTRDETIAWMAEIVLPSREVWVAELPTELAGDLALAPTTLEHLYVAPEHQGRGVGSQLLELAQQHRSHLELHVFQRNHAARRFYERSGFHLVELSDGSGNEEREPDAIYRWTKTTTWKSARGVHPTPRDQTG